MTLGLSSMMVEVSPLLTELVPGSSPVQSWIILPSIRKPLQIPEGSSYCQQNR